jgi:hypothetical protein
MTIDQEKRDVWLHVHVPKAGGSTLRHLMNRNFGSGYYNSTSLLEVKQYRCDEVSEIVRCHPWVRCFSDHKLSLDLPYHHADANVRAICFVRDPVERFISRYFFHRHFEEVNCLAQRVSFRDFAESELVRKECHPQTNSQIYFLNGGRSSEEMTVIQSALATGQAFLFPIERFDESCICLERMFPEAFTDLSYVRANESKKDAEISQADRNLIRSFVEADYQLMEAGVELLERTLSEQFPDANEFDTVLAEFQDRCHRRYDNFQPPVEPGQPFPDHSKKRP